MSDFWSRKKAELEETGQIAKPHVALTSHDGPWWQEGRQQEVQPSMNKVGMPEMPRAQEEMVPTGPVCPTCRSGNYWKPNNANAARCFDCGHVDGRTLNEPNIPTGIQMSAPVIKPRQIKSGGHFGKTAAEIAENNAALEQSAQGRVKLT